MTAINYTWQGPVYYIDWSGARPLAILKNDEEEVDRSFTKLIPFFESIANTNALVILEPTFSSFEKQDRQNELECAEKNGVTIRTVSTRCTSWRRLDKGIVKGDLKKIDSDVIDAGIIRLRVKEGAHLHDPSNEPDKEYLEIFNLVQKTLVFKRFTGTKKDYAMEMVARIIPFKEIDDANIKSALRDGNSNRYNLVKVAVMAACSEYARSTKDMERLCGLYEHGYPSVMRSDLMKHGWSHIRVRTKDRLTFSQYRKALRWLFRQCRDVHSKLTR